jgi:5-methylcytosine-specific restriction endonuclease McrA
MSPIRPKRPRVRLDPDSYRQLCLEVLQRDGWRCQSCGSLENLQVHHQEFRSRSGDDSEDNLITLCARCHQSFHRRVIEQALETGAAADTGRRPWFLRMLT